MAVKIFRINYKSDFILTLSSDAGWETPFCIKFWTDSPQRAFYAQYDGETYTHCAPVEGEPTKLMVQMDDHHLGVGDLKFQIAYHFTVADFPNDTEDEVINQAAVIIDNNGEAEQVMLDFNGETAPEIAFSLPAYANEQQRIANEQQRIANEEQRISNEETRIAAENIRQQNEEIRIAQEETRVTEFARLKRESETATTNANAAADLANEKAQLAADKASLAQAAATLANEKAQLAADKAALAQAAATLANDKAALAQQKAEYAQQQGGYAKEQGDYAKNQGDYAKEQGDTALADHQRAEADHGIAVDDHTRAEQDHTTAANDHTQAASDHTRAEVDHSTASADHTTATNDHTQAVTDHATATSDHTQAGNDHTRAESDHTRAESDHAAVEVYVDSLGVFDLSKHNAVGGVLATYADLDAALTALNAIDSKYKYGGMSIKYVQSSDNKYVQYRLTADDWSTSTFDWERYNDITTSNQSVSDLDFSDEEGNVLVRFQGGDIKTKNFDSSKNATTEERGLMSAEDKVALNESVEKLSTIEDGAEVNDVITDDVENADLDISDEDRNVLVRFQGGDIKTKNFDSRFLYKNIKGKKLSILGDSISTFEGTLPSSSYLTYYPTGNVTSVNQMWWKIVADKLGLTIGANASWSGSRLVGNAKSTISAECAASTKRVNDLAQNGTPDIIIVYIGINDLVTSNHEVMGEVTSKDHWPGDIDTDSISVGYAVLISKLLTTYPFAQIYICSLFANANSQRLDDDGIYPTRNGNGIYLEDVNAKIKELTIAYGAHFIDMATCGIHFGNISDVMVDHATHPNAYGQNLMAEYIINNILK